MLPEGTISEKRQESKVTMQAQLCESHGIKSDLQKT